MDTAPTTTPSPAPCLNLAEAASPYRRQRFGDSLGRSERIIAQLEADHEPKRAHQLRWCCEAPTLWWTEEGGRWLMCESRCRSRCCPLCARLRARDAHDRILEATRDFDSLRFLTLTMKHNDRPLAEQVADLLTWFRRLRRRKAWKTHVTGGVAVIEVKWSIRDDRWHPHLHAVIDGTFWPQRQIAREWREVTNESSIVDIRRPPSRSAVARYVAKYITDSSKIDNVPPERITEWAEALHGARLLHTFGSAFRSKVEARPSLWSPDAAMVCHHESLHELNPHVAARVVAAAKAPEPIETGPDLLRTVRGLLQPPMEPEATCRPSPQTTLQF